jgi:hypothetical protein
MSPQQWMILMPSEIMAGQRVDSLYNVECLKLTVLAGDVGRRRVLVLVLIFMMLVVPYLLNDLIEKVVEKLVRILVHDAAEVLIPIAKLVDECTRRNGTLISWIPGNKYIEGAESGEERRGRGGNDDGWGRGGGWDVGWDLSSLGFAARKDRVGGWQCRWCLSGHGGG